MSYFNQIQIQSSDSPSVDAFARWRTSDSFTIFDSKQLYDTASYQWATKIIGDATASFVPNNASVRMIATGNPSAVIRQSKRRHVYQPGKSHLIITTGNFSASNANSIERIGYFDNNNGIYFTSTGSSFGIGIRTNISGTPVDTFVSRSAWNIDKFDGTGVSGRTLNISSSQIYFMDFEWLGVGRVRYGIFQGGIPYYVHNITNINSLNTVYMSTPNLPIRYEIINSGSGAQSMLHICSAVSSEGGYDKNGVIRAVSNPSGQTLNSGLYSGMIAIRLKSSSLDGGVIPVAVNSAQTTANVVYEVTLLVNPSGSLNWSWQDLPNSVVQYATGSSALTIANEGTKIFSAINAGTTSTNDISYDPAFALGSDIDGNQDVLVLGWRGVSGNASNACTSLIWREI
jgi:hypothetical protein